MNTEEKRLFVVRCIYWLGIGADALWAVALLVPAVFGLLTGNPGFSPNFELQHVMGVAGSLMTGWTVLLIWAEKEPIERRAILLITAFPVVFGIHIATLFYVLSGNFFVIWVLIKSALIFIALITSYLIADKLAKENSRVISVDSV